MVVYYEGTGLFAFPGKNQLLFDSFFVKVDNKKVSMVFQNVVVKI